MIAERVRGITPFLAMEVLERAQKLEREGASIIHLELGEPDFDTPEHIRKAAIEAIVFAPVREESNQENVENNE